MPLSKKNQAAWMRHYRKERREERENVYFLGVKDIISKADVRAMRKVGLNPENIENESGKVSSRSFYALQRDRDAIKAHLSWHHDQLGKSDIGTIVEQLQARITLLEADFTLHEAREAYQTVEY